MLNCPNCNFQNYAEAVTCFSCSHKLTQTWLRRASQIRSPGDRIPKDQTEIQEVGEATARPSWANGCPKCDTVVPPFLRRCPGCETRLNPTPWRRMCFLTAIVIGTSAAVVMAVGASGLFLIAIFLILAAGVAVGSKPSGFGSLSGGFTYNVARGDGSGSELSGNS